MILIFQIRKSKNKFYKTVLTWFWTFSVSSSLSGISMDDNYFLHENYKKLLPKKSKTAIPEDVFLFVVYYAFSQIHSQDFTQRSAAVICLRDFIRHSKKCDPELFRVTVDNHIADIISRGLASTNYWSS